MAKKKSDLGDRAEDLSQILHDALNKDEKVAYFFGGEEDTPADLNGWVSTSSTELDLAVSNRPHGGFPAGRIIELIGKEGSGKSLIAAHVLANTIKAGGVGVLIDTEAAVNEEFYAAIGMDMKKLIYVHTLALEDIYAMVLKIIEKVRSTDKDTMVTIVIDSLSQASTLKEIEADFQQQGYATAKSQINSTAMRKITSLLAKQKVLLLLTSQIRDKMNAMPFGPQWETSGGKAVRFAASARVFLAPIGKIKDKDKNIIGIKVKASIIKNRFGPPHREAEFDIYFDRGIDDEASWVKLLGDAGVIKTGAYNSYTDGSGEKHTFRKDGFFDFLQTHPDLQEKFYTLICDHYIMRYRSTDSKREVDFTGVIDNEDTEEGSSD
jgi:recombination protein RecA